MSTEQPSVVFGICTRNEADTIRESMRSIRDQSIPPDLVLVCDDSDDETADIVESAFASSSVPCEVFQQGRYDGHGGARQELFERASDHEPDLLCLLDAEHAIGPDWLSAILTFRRANPEYGVLTGPGCSRELHRPCESPHDPLYYRHATMAIEFDLLELVGGWDPDFDRGEDWDLAIRLYRAGVRTFASSWWCSRFIGSDDFATRRARIAGNPTSVPYMSKYGRWYARFHPAQLVKDGACVLFYLLLIAGALAIPFGPDVAGPLLSSAVPLASSYVLAHHLYHRRDGHRTGRSIEQPLLHLLYTTPAVVRSLRQLAAGCYRRKSGTD